ncbi:hypothetical protein MNV49_001191 [Pseudohyphozyma bogoriensis]|nr:hypothetical protein MNV49_001191 [Pseudohyphozyma bogoriensis]
MDLTQDDGVAPTILASASVPYIPMGNSRCLVPNADGQIALVTRNDVHILTPGYGIQVDALVLQAARQGEDAGDDEGGKGKGKEREKEDEMPLFKTLIRIEKKDVLEWHLWNNSLDTLSGGAGQGPTRELLWRSVCWSPVGLGQLGGCILAAMTTNHEVLLYEPLKNAHRGAWTLAFDVTAVIVRLLLPHNLKNEDEKPSLVPLTEEQLREQALLVLECQTTALAWSPPVPNTVGDFSLLVLGHKSGHISLWRLWGGKMEILHRYRMDDNAQWLTGLTWSPWEVTTDGTKTTAVSTLAVSDSRGAIWVVDIKQDVPSPRSSLVPEGDAMQVDMDASVVSATVPMSVGNVDGRAASQLCWAVKDEVSRLVYTKLGTVNVATFKASTQEDAARFELADEVELELELPSGGQWFGSNTYSPCAGIEYVPEKDAVILALSSASFYVVKLSPSPSVILETPSDSLPCSSGITKGVRTLFENSPVDAERFTKTIKTGGMKFSNKQGARIRGLVAFGREGQLGWIYESDYPDLIVSRLVSMMKTKFVLSPLIDGDASPETVVGWLSDLLQNPPNARIAAPLGNLRAVLQGLEGHVGAEGLLESVAAILPVERSVTNSTSSQAPFGSAEEVLAASLEGLFGDEYLEGLRLRETVARFVLRLPNLPDWHQHSAVVLHTSLARQIAQELTSRIGNILTRANALLTSTELMISGRILLASASLLKEEGAVLEDGSIAPPDALSIALEGHETCPACRAPIPFANIRRAQCVNGHEWERCSITLSVISTVKARTCVGCERKALMELVDSPPTSVVNTLIKVATCCLYCGGRWMRIR